MTYTQITTTPDKTYTREITEAEMINLMSQVLILKQCGEENEWKRIYTPDYLHLVRYELIRKFKGKTVITHFIPNAE
jgi:hypothetical protein